MQRSLNRFRVPGTTAVALLVFLGAGVALPADAMVEASSANAAVDAPDCAGLDFIVVNGSTQCVVSMPFAHAEAMSAMGAMAATETAPPRAHAEHRTAAAAATVTGPLCDGDGISGPRVEVLYVVASDVDNRFTTLRDSFDTILNGVDQIFLDSAAETGGVRRVRWVTDTPCRVRVTPLVVPPWADDHFGATTQAVMDLGYNQPNRKYLMFVDAAVLCGIAGIYIDSSPGQTNPNNAYTLHSRVDINACYSSEVAAHELGHTLGAVQPDAPNATPYLHCTDENDVMCYADNASASMTTECDVVTPIFDCNHDDYFSTNPPAGSYLATHWNTANSAFLTDGTMSSPPSPPTNLGVLTRSGLAIVAWAAPPTGTVGSYTVTMNPGDRTCATSASVRHCTFTGLTDNVSYSFSVQAINDVGSSPPSDVATATPPGTYRPSGLTALARGTSALLSWTAPVDDGGGQLGSYRVSAQPSGQTWNCSPLITSCSVAGVAPGTHSFSVVAVTPAGTSGPSNQVSLIAPGSFRPQRVGTTKVGANVQVGWSAPAGDGGGAITGYVVAASPSGRRCNAFAPALTCTLASLPSSVTETVTVVASGLFTDGVRWTSAASAPVLIPPAPARPAAPGVPRGVAGNGRVALSWVAPGNGGAAINDYVVQMSRDGGVTWTVAADPVSASTGAVVAGLVNGSSYVFRVAAVNSVGRGAFGAKSAVLTPLASPPAGVAVPTGVPGNGRVVLTWKAPNNGGAPITDYLVQRSTNNGVTWATVTDGVRPATGATATGLVNGQRYVFRVAARNARGYGAWSAKSALITPRTTPATPIRPTVVRGVRRVTVRWLAPANGGAAITDYVVQWSSNNGVTWTTFADGVRATTGATVTGLVRGRRYVFRLAARNAAGSGAFSVKSLGAYPS